MKTIIWCMFEEKFTIFVWLNNLDLYSKTIKPVGSVLICYAALGSIKEVKRSFTRVWVWITMFDFVRFQSLASIKSTVFFLYSLKIHVILMYHDRWENSLLSRDLWKTEKWTWNVFGYLINILLLKKILLWTWKWTMNSFNFFMNIF